MRKDLPIQEGSSGDWKIEKFEVSKEAAKLFNIRQLYNRSRRYIDEGIYWRLLHNDVVIMSDTPAEMDDHLKFINNAHGDVLIAGLGIGMVVHHLLQKESVTNITVIEKSEDVIKLVSPYYKSDKLKIIHADIFDFKTSKKFDYAWFDIWDSIDSSNYKQMKFLNRKFARNIKHKDSWCRKECIKLLKE